MKIAYIVTDFVPVSETFIRDLSAALHERKHDVRIFCQTKLDGVIDASLPIEVVGCEPRASLMSRIRRFALRGEKERIEEFDWQRRTAWFVQAFEPGLGQFDPDIIYAEYGWNGVLAAEVARRLSKPIIMHLHGLDASEHLALPAYVKRLNEAAAAGARFIVPSHHLRRRLMLVCPQAQNVYVIPCGPSVKLLGSATLKVTNASDGLRVVAIGRLTPKKAPQALLHAIALAAREVPDLRFHLVGDGPLRSEVEDTIKRLGIESVVTLYGARSHNEALSVLCGARLFVQHSVTSASGDQEGLPVAILEALALGIPVVSTIHSGIPEIVEEGVGGFLVREWDYETMAKQIIRVLRSDFKVPASAREKVLSLEQRVAQVENAFAETVSVASRKV